MPQMGFSDRKASIVAEAYRRTKSHVAYLDESYQAPDPIGHHRKTFYLFTAVVVAQDDMDELRGGLLEIAGSTHWHTTEALLTAGGRRATEDMLGYLADGKETCVIAHQVSVDPVDHDAEDARRACYRSLAEELAAGRAGSWSPIELLILEERNQRNFRNKDDKNHKELIRENRIPRNTRLLQTSPSAERLLWLPDLVSSAFRRTITHTDGTNELFEIVKPQVYLLEAGD